MDLSNNHRRALLARLEAALEKKQELGERLKNETPSDTLDVVERREIENYLNNKEIEVIREAIIDVEIDY